MNEIGKIAQGGNFIDNSYFFFYQAIIVHVLNLNNPACVAILNKNGNVQKISIDDIELSIVQK